MQRAALQVLQANAGEDSERLCCESTSARSHVRSPAAGSAGRTCAVLAAELAACEEERAAAVACVSRLQAELRAARPPGVTADWLHEALSRCDDLSLERDEAQAQVAGVQAALQQAEGELAALRSQSAAALRDARARRALQAGALAALREENAALRAALEGAAEGRGGAHTGAEEEARAEADSQRRRAAACELEAGGQRRRADRYKLLARGLHDRLKAVTLGHEAERLAVRASPRAACAAAAASAAADAAAAEPATPLAATPPAPQRR